MKLIMFIALTAIAATLFAQSFSMPYEFSGIKTIQTDGSTNIQWPDIRSVLNNTIEFWPLFILNEDKINRIRADDVEKMGTKLCQNFGYKKGKIAIKSSSNGWFRNHLYSHIDVKSGNMDRLTENSGEYSFDIIERLNCR